MFKMFTWGQYAGLVGLLLLVYYLYVGAVYYRAELLAKLRGKGSRGIAPAAAGPVAARPSLVGSAGPLLPQATLAAQVLPEKTRPVVAQTATEAEEAQAAPTPVEEVKMEEPTNEVVNEPAAEELADELPGQQAPDSAAEFTLGVAQLSDYFEDAAAGKLTQEELVAKVPEVENTDLLVAFFQRNSRTAQQLTAQYYVDVAEPVLE